MSLTKIIIICGPTGVGKSQIAIELAKKFQGEIVNADSQQVYIGLDIGTAKLNLAQTCGIPHHLIDIVTPDKHFDASIFMNLADQAIAEITSRKNTPFIVGGTGLYLRLLINGICEAPAQDPELRKQYEAYIVENGIEYLHARLRKIDPESAGVIHPNDRTRIIRALEIFDSCGKTASQFYLEQQNMTKRYQALKIGLNISRDQLYARLNARVEAMLENGWIEEVKELLSRYGSQTQALQAIGYKEIVSHLQGELKLEELAMQIKQQTRHYAKRQLTWFRGDPEVIWFAPAEMDKIAEKIEFFLGSN
ncbi:MAG: tRNA (adenosine(37)-N6)-dimethylallyltransferase MiaA [Pseudomonadota bacterium]